MAPCFNFTESALLKGHDGHHGTASRSSDACRPQPQPCSCAGEARYVRDPGWFLRQMSSSGTRYDEFTSSYSTLFKAHFYQCTPVLRALEPLKKTNKLTSLQNSKARWPGTCSMAENV